MKRIWLVCILTALTFSTYGLENNEVEKKVDNVEESGAEDSDVIVFESDDKIDKQILKATAEENKQNSFLKNTIFTFRNNLFYLTHSSIEENTIQNYFSLSAKNSLQKNNWKFNSNIFINYTTEDNRLQGFFTPPRKKFNRYKYIDATELNLNYYGKLLDFTIGKAFVNPGKYNRGYSVVNGGSQSMGVWQSKVSYTINEESSVQFIYIPWLQTYTLSKAPQITDVNEFISEYLDGQLNLDIIGGGSLKYIAAILKLAPGLIKLTTPDPNSKKLDNAFLVQYKGYFPKFDVVLGMYRGPANEYVVGGDISKLEIFFEHPEVFARNLSLSFDYRGVQYTLTGNYQHSIHAHDNDFFEYSVSAQDEFVRVAEKLGAKKLYINLRYSNLEILKRQTHLIYLISSTDLKHGNDTVSANFVLEVNNDLILGLFGLYQKANEFAVATLGARYKFTDDLNMHIGYTDFFYSGDSALIDNIRRNNNLSLQINYTF